MPTTEPIRFDTDPIEWARQVARLAAGLPPTRPILITHWDMWEGELFPESESGDGKADD